MFDVKPEDSFNIELIGVRERMVRAAREMLCQFFLSEEESKAIIETQMKYAMASTDWQKMFHGELEAALKKEVDSFVHSMIQQIMWDKDVRDLLKERLIKSLAKSGE